MADEVEQTDEPQPKAKSPGLMTLVKAVAVISVIVVVEIVAASALIPTAEETATAGEKIVAAEAALGQENGEGEKSEQQQDSEPWVDTREVSLGPFHVVTVEHSSGASISIDFELYGTVLAEEKEEFYSLFEINQHRIEEQVVITMRGVEMTDLSDANLGLIKRKILEKTNRALGKPLLREAIFSKFLHVER